MKPNRLSASFLPSPRFAISLHTFAAFGLGGRAPTTKSLSAPREIYAQRSAFDTVLPCKAAAAAAGTPGWQFNGLFVGLSFGPRIGPSFGHSVKLKIEKMGTN